MSESRAPIPTDYRFLFKAIPGVKGGGCSMDVWFPEETGKAAHPVVIMIHGGAWMIGNSDGIPFNQVRYLLKHGIAVVSVEYRFAPHASLDEIREDLLDSYEYLQIRLNNDIFEAGGSSMVDGSRSCAFGWSAGGANAVFLGCDILKRPHLPRLRAVIPTYPLADLEEFNAPIGDFQKLCDSKTIAAEANRMVNDQACSVAFRMDSRLYAAALGFDKLKSDDITISGIDELQAGSRANKIPPRTLLLAAHASTRTLGTAVTRQNSPFDPRHSPIHIVTSEFPPTCVVVATDDTLIPPSQSRDLHARIVALGVESTVVECEGMAHGEAECLPGARWLEEWSEQAIRPSLDFGIAKLLVV